MRILLFNDNPVVRKLVTLSAQKTKDMLDVVWSVDEIEQGEYDLLIMDDALYSDEVFESIKEHVIYSKALLMATRGNAVPAGFDSVINKPFLPTDLVEILIQMNKTIGSSTRSAAMQEVPSEMPIQNDDYEINLEESMPKTAPSESEAGEPTLDHLDEEEIDLDSFDETFLDDLDGDLPQILDQEEVMEVQNLLDDDEEESVPAEPAENSDYESLLAEVDAITSADTAEAAADDFGFDGFDDEPEEEQANIEEAAMDTELPSESAPETDDVAESLSALEMKIQQAMKGVSPEALDIELDDAAWDEEVMDDALDGLEMMEDDTAKIDLADGLEEDDLLDEDEFGLMENEDESVESPADMTEESAEALEEEALDIPDFDFDDETEEDADFVIPELEEDEESAGEVSLNDAELDEFYGLDERDIKLAFGEEVSDEELFEEDASPLDMDETDFADAIVPESVTQATPDEETEAPVPSQAEGIEALQALLKVLSNEEVAKSLKALNISININFGNEQ